MQTAECVEPPPASDAAVYAASSTEATGKEATNDNEADTLNCVTVEPTVEVSPVAILPKTTADGGWGWMVVFASFTIHVIIDGIGFTFGVFMEAYAEHFECDAMQTSALMSTLLGVYMLSGPLAAGLIKSFGTRIVGMTGAFVSAAAFVACTFSPNILTMLVLYGVIGGFGLGLMYVPSVTSVGYHFNKRRPIALGIAMCGTGFGTLLFGPLGAALLEIYDWKNAHYILAGVLLNGAVFSSLLRPQSLTNTDSDQSIEASADSDDRFLVGDALDPAVKEETGGDLQAAATSAQMIAVHSGSPLLRCDDIRKSPSPPAIGDNHQRRLSVREISRFALLLQFCSAEEVSRGAHVSELSFSSVQQSASSPMTRIRRIVGVLAADLALFKNVAFMIISLAAFLAQVAFLIPYGFLTAKAKALGSDAEDSAFLLSYLGVANILGHIGSSAIVQAPRITALPVHNFMLGAASFFMLATPLCTTYIDLVVCAAGYGFFIGGHVTLPPIFLCEILGLEKLTSSFGLLTFIRGIAIIVGPIVAGAIFDSTGSYDNAFVVGGLLALLSTLLFCLLFIPRIRHLL